jgi:histidyl-tRNA synthetase
VWRGENTQRGRYREFVQCDFDTIGTDANASDIETLMVIHDLMEAIGFTGFTIRVNHRQVLNGMLERLGLLEQSAGVLRALDKLPKIGAEAVIAEMVERVGASREQAERVLAFAGLQGTPAQILDQLQPIVQGSERGEQGLSRLRELFEVCRRAGLPDERIELDVAIARGLDYYTGTIYETFLNDDPKIGSVCSGGRYDNLAGLFTKQPLPGVGASLGLDRLLAAMESMQLLKTGSTPAQVLVACFDESRLADYVALGRRLRQAGIATEVYPQAKPLKKQLQYADKKGFRLAVIAGGSEFEAGTWQVKNLSAQQQATVSDGELVANVRQLLES